MAAASQPALAPQGRRAPDRTAADRRLPLTLYAAAFGVNVAVILAGWWLGSGSRPSRGLGDDLNALGRVTGLLGTYLALWQLLLMTRQPWLERALGMERQARLHRVNAYLVLGLLVAHGVLQTAGYQVLDNLGTLAQLQDFVRAYEGLLPALAALGLLVLVVAASITVSRRRLAYETWYFIHLYAYLAIALAFAHELAVGADLIANRWFAAYWWMLYAVVVGCLSWYRLLGPLRSWWRHRFRVLAVQ